MFGFIKDAVKVIGDIIGGDKVKDVAEAIAGDPKVKAELEKLSVEAENNLRELLKAEVASEDKFVRRARPSLLWLITIIVGFNYILLPLANVIMGTVGEPQIILVYPDLPESVYWLFGTIFSVYAGARSFDKYKKTKK